MKKCHRSRTIVLHFLEPNPECRHFAVVVFEAAHHLVSAPAFQLFVFRRTGRPDLAVKVRCDTPDMQPGLARNVGQDALASAMPLIRRIGDPASDLLCVRFSGLHF